MTAADLLVVRRELSGVDTELELNTDYTVAGVGNAQGTITLTEALQTGEILAIIRSPALLQPAAFANQGAYFGKSHEDALDRLAMQVQAIDDVARRSARVADSYSPGAIEMRLRPEPGKVLAWQSSTELGNSALDSSAVALPGNGRTVESLSAYLSNNKLFNVKDYGALGNGTVDDYDAIAACDAAAAAAGYDVYFPPGTYNIETSITATTSWHLAHGVTLALAAGNTLSLGSDCRLSGEGVGSVIKTLALRTAALMSIRNVQNVEVTGLRITHDGYLPALIGDPAFGLIEIGGGSVASPCRRIRVHDCWFEGNQPALGAGRTEGRMGVWVNPLSDSERVNDVVIANNQFRQLWWAITAGSFTSPAPTAERIDGLQILGNQIVGTGESAQFADTKGIQLFKRAKNVAIADNLSRDNGMNIILAHGGENVTVTGNVTIDGDTGIVMDANVGTYPTATYGRGCSYQVTGNQCLGGNYGIRFIPADAINSDPSSIVDFPFHIVISGNLVWGCNYDGIQVSAPFVTVSGNVVAECCLSASDDTDFVALHPGGRAGIRVGVNSPDAAGEYVHDVTVVGNVSLNNRSSHATRKTNGFHFHHCKRVTVSGNVAVDDANFTAFSGQQDVGFRVGATCEKLTFKGNTAEGNADADLDIDGTAEVFAETIAILIGSAAAGSEFVKPVFIAPHRAHVLSYSFANAAAVAFNAVNFTTLILRNKGTDGLSSDNIGDIDTTATAFVAFVPRAVETPHATRKKLVKGTILAVEKEDENAGAAITDMLFTLNYATH